MVHYIQRTFCLLLIFFLFSHPANLLAENKKAAKTPAGKSRDLIQLAKQKGLGSSSQWLRLLHYNRGGTLHSQNKSYVKSKSFFLSENGNTNSETELEFNIRAFFNSDIKQRCIFPARFHWLSIQLDQDNYLKGLSHCDTFLKIQRKVAAQQITLIFPSAYLNSASSIFGHTLLRIDNSKDDEAPILNWAINYGAKLNDDNGTKKDGALKYAVKGIFGLYDGQYFIVPYSQKIKEYGQIENRDIWEYPLSLSQDEVIFLTEHLWELKDINFNYFFFDENCSFRLLELLEVAKPELDLTSQLRLTEIPINTVKILEENKLIKETIFRPSKERLLNHRFKNLDTSLSILSKAISQNTKLLESDLFQSLTSKSQLNVLHAAYEYLRFQQSQETRNPEIAKRSLDLLKAINEISIKNQKKNNPENPSSGEKPKSPMQNDGKILKTHNSHRVKASAGKLVDEHNYQTFQYRMAYHDLIDNSEGFFSGAHIEGASITIKQTNTKTFVDEITLVDIVSLNPQSHIQKDYSWGLGIQAKRNPENNSHLHTIFRGDGGFAWNLNSSYITYQLLSPRLEVSPDFENNVKGGVELKLGLLRNSGKHPSLLELNALKLDGENTKYLGRFLQQMEVNRNHAFRIEFNYFKQERIENTAESKSIALGYLYYF